MILRSLLKQFIRAYQRWISPLLLPGCRFHPSCSEYAWQALDQLPLPKAMWNIVARLSKCHPYHEGGHDPVIK